MYWKIDISLYNSCVYQQNIKSLDPVNQWKTIHKVSKVILVRNDQIQYRFEGFLFNNKTETDAVHHRLAGESPAVEKNFQCYDCNQLFFSLANLVDHSHACLWHSLEMCLKCTDPVTVYIQKFPAKVIRLHSCKDHLIRHENSDLWLFSVQISKILCWNEPIQRGKDESAIVILCQSCDNLFPQTCKGLYDYFIHSSHTNHNVITSSQCRKCCMNDFQLNCTNGERLIAHFCTKDCKTVLKEHF